MILKPKTGLLLEESFFTLPQKHMTGGTKGKEYSFFFKQQGRGYFELILEVRQLRLLFCGSETFAGCCVKEILIVDCWNLAQP
jgi:hypothetical protein